MISTGSLFQHLQTHGGIRYQAHAITLTTALPYIFHIEVEDTSKHPCCFQQEGVTIDSKYMD